jgi:hypothetical protein
VHCTFRAAHKCSLTKHLKSHAVGAPVLAAPAVVVGAVGEPQPQAAPAPPASTVA